MLTQAIKEGDNDYDDMIIIGNLNPCYLCMTAFKNIKTGQIKTDFLPKNITIISSELNLHKRDLNKASEKFVDAEDLLSLGIGVSSNIRLISMPKYDHKEVKFLLTALNLEPTQRKNLFNQDYILGNSVNSLVLKTLSAEIFKDRVQDIQSILSVLTKYRDIVEQDDFLNKLPITNADDIPLAFVQDMCTIMVDCDNIIAQSVKDTAKIAFELIEDKYPFLETTIAQLLEMEKTKRISSMNKSDYLPRSEAIDELKSNLFEVAS